MLIRKVFSSRTRLFRGTTILLISIVLLLFVLSAPKFEDGFESGSFSLWDKMSPANGLGAPSIVEHQTHHGRYGAGFSSNPVTNNLSYVDHSVGSSTDLYARGYFSISESNLKNDENRFVLITFRARNDSLPVAYVGWRNYSGPVKWYLFIMNAAGGYNLSRSNLEPLIGRWYSVELHWREGLVAELWVDDLLACSSVEKPTSGSGGVDAVRIGLGEPVTGGSTVVYVDCVAISGSRIWSETPFASPRTWFLLVGIASAGILVGTFVVDKWSSRFRTNISRDEETVVY